MSNMCVIYLSAIPKPSLDRNSMYNKLIRHFNISVFGFFKSFEGGGGVWKDLTDVHKCPQVQLISSFKHVFETNKQNDAF